MALDVDPQIREYRIHLTLEDKYGEITYCNYSCLSKDGYGDVLNKAKCHVKIDWDDVISATVEKRIK